MGTTSRPALPVAAMESLQCLKQALDAGLITAADYDTGKTAFLRAQQIRSGFESGLLSKADYESVKASFLTSLSGAGETGSQPPPGSAPAAARPSAVAAAPAPAAAARVSAPGPPRAPPPPAPAPPPPQALPPAPRSSQPAAAAPEDGAHGVCVGGKSLSGISVTQHCVSLYQELKSKSAYRFITFKIDGSGQRVVADQCSAGNASFADFTEALPEHDSRYAVFDFAYVNADGCQLKKIIFIMWSPDTAQIKAKMMYASTKDFFKGLLPGIALEQQATEIGEVDEEEMRLRIQATLTRK